MSDTEREDLDRYDQALSDYVHKEIKFTDPEVIDELLRRYGGSPNETIEISHGRNCASEASYKNTLGSLSGGSFETDGSIMSWSPDRGTALGFALCRKTYNNMMLASLSMSDLKEGERVSGHGGILMTANIAADKVIDLRKSPVMAEAEVLVLPNTVLHDVSFEEQIPYSRQLEECVDPNALIKSTSDQHLKSYILTHAASMLSDETIEPMISRAEYEFREMARPREGCTNNDLYGDDECANVEDRGWYRLKTVKSLYGEDHHYIKSEADTIFFISEHNDKRITDGYSEINAELPWAWIELYEQSLLSPAQADQLSSVVTEMAMDAIQLVEEFGVSRICPRVSDGFKLFCDENVVLDLTDSIVANSTMGYREQDYTSTETTPSQHGEQVEKVKAVLTSLFSGLSVQEVYGSECIKNDAGREVVVPEKEPQRIVRSQATPRL